MINQELQNETLSILENQLITKPGEMQAPLKKLMDDMGEEEGDREGQLLVALFGAQLIELNDNLRRIAAALEGRNGVLE